MIEGSEAGGHIGPVSLNVLAQEILPHIREVPVFVAGGLGRGEAILRLPGNGGVRRAARHALRRHDGIHRPSPKFKQAFIRADARDAVPSVQLDERFPVIPVRGLVNEGTKRFLRHQAETRDRFLAGELDKEAAQLAIEHFWAGALRRAVIDGDVENGSMMAGQSVGMVTAGAIGGRGHRRAGGPGGRRAGRNAEAWRVAPEARGMTWQSTTPPPLEGGGWGRGADRDGPRALAPLPPSPSLKGRGCR